MDRAYLLAEIISSTDDTRVPDTDAKWIDVKRTIYLAHAACEAVLIIEQDRMEVRLDTRTTAGWSSQTLGPADELKLPAFGLQCAVADLYEGTRYGLAAGASGPPEPHVTRRARHPEKLSIRHRKNILLYRNSVSAYVSPIPAHPRGAILWSSLSRAGLAVDAAASAREVRAGRVVPVSP